MVNYELPTLNSSFDTGDVSTPENDYLLRQLSALLTQKQNIHGRRIGKAKDAVSPADYITKRQIPFSLIGTLAQRPTPNGIVNGTTYYATDRTVTYIAYNNHWYYRDGVQFVTLSPNTKPSLSILYDIGYRIYSTDFLHYYHWTGLVWIAEDNEFKKTAFFFSAPAIGGWALLDGSTVTRSKPDATTESVTLNNLTSTGRYIKTGTVSSANAAVAPGLSGTTSNENATHTHGFTPVGSATGNVTDHTHGVSFTSGSGNLTLSGNVGTGITASAGGGDLCTDASEPVGEGFGTVYVAECAHSHTITAHLDSGSVSFSGEDHTHAVEGSTAGMNEAPLALDLTFTGSHTSTDGQNVNHQHTKGSMAVDATGEPANIIVLPYTRL